MRFFLILCLTLPLWAQEVPEETAKPKPLDSETKLVLAEKVILIQQLQRQVSEAQRQLDGLLAEYNLTVTDLRQKHEAEGCQLNARQDWVNCPAEEKPEPAPESSEP